MALFNPGSPCPLCNAPITERQMNDGILYASTYWGIADKTFAILDDAVVHQRCIDTWEHRDAFVRYYNQNCRDELWVTKSGSVCYRPTWLPKWMARFLGNA